MTNENKPENKILLSANDIMLLCGVGRNTAYKIIHEINPINIGGKKIKRSELDLYIERQQKEA